jgi:hypothetical protein
MRKLKQSSRSQIFNGQKKVLWPMRLLDLVVWICFLFKNVNGMVLRYILYNESKHNILAYQAKANNNNLN